MSDFTLESMAAHLGALAVEMHEIEQHALTKAGEIVKEEVVSEFGTYQGAAGPFAAWAPLKQATIDRKATGDSPLLETGELRDSIGVIITEHEAHIGSNEDKAVWQELGTDKIPPRSFLGGGAVRATPDVLKAIGGELHGFLIGGGSVKSIE